MNTITQHLNKGLHAIVRITTDLEYKDEYRLMRNIFGNVYPLTYGKELYYLIDIVEKFDVYRSRNTLHTKLMHYVQSKDREHVELFNDFMKPVGEITNSKKHWGYCYRNLRTGEYYKFVRGH